jgi:protocatechuate 4,5-dioxygenase beta chain
MAKIVAGIGVSHVPSIGPAYDKGRFNEPDWKPLFAGVAHVKKWLAEEVKPDVALVIYNDHGCDFGLDRVPTFAIGTQDEYEQSDEGFGLRPLPNVPGDSELSWFLARELVYNEFDMTVVQEMKLDHGFLVPMPLFFQHNPGWNIKSIPLVVNVIQHPIPTGRRCLKLGHAIRKAVEAYDRDTRVVIIGTGGMSHQLHGERFGHLNSGFDQYWLDMIESDPQELAEMDHKHLMAEAGAEAVELIMWLTMRGAMSDNARRVHRTYYAPMTTGMAVISFLNP